MIGLPQEVCPGILQLEIPLPGSPLKSVNAYIIPGDGRPLLIDTGMNRPECRDTVEHAFAHLGLSLANTDFFITHYHADHLGLAPVLAAPGAAIYMGARDAAVVNAMTGKPRFWEEMARRATPFGMPSGEVAAVFGHHHPAVKYRTPGHGGIRPLPDGAPIHIGEFAFTCVETPGHTAGHMCLFESRRAILISGDHVLGDISPNIAAFHADENPLHDYLASLDKVAALPVRTVLPGHRAPFANLTERVQQLKQHHEARVEETLAVLQGRACTAYETAASLTWDIRVKEWDQFPVLQKWFATGEAAAHLHYLAALGRIHATSENGITRYRV